jgi:hypothetical protein
MTLNIPNTVASNVNDKDTYKVYSESEIIDSTSPEVRVKQKKKTWLQKLVTIITIVIMIAVAFYVAEFAAGLFSSIGSTAAGTTGAAAGTAATTGIAGLGRSIRTPTLTKCKHGCLDNRIEHDLSKLNADHPVDLVIGGSATQSLKLLNESINMSVGSSLLQAGRKAKLNPGDIIKDVEFQKR